MNKGYRYLLLSAFFAVFSISCEKDLPGPVAEQMDTSDEIALMKEALDQEILDVIRTTGEPFDWNEADDEMLMRAMLVTGYPLVVGYHNTGNDSRAIRNELLELIYESEGVKAARLGAPDEVLVHEQEELGYFHARIHKQQTIEALRNLNSLRFVEMSGYPILLDEIAAHYQGRKVPDPGLGNRNMVLDPFQEDPDYFSQLSAYDGGAATCFRRHNVDHVYRDHQIYGENTGIAVLDNGLLPEHQAFLEANGYGAREVHGYYNPLWFLPWTQPDGTTPQPSDISLISLFVDSDWQWVHGWSQNKQALMAIPNADQYSVRSSTIVFILLPAQILGVVKGILAMAQDPDIRIISMAMGGIFRIHQMEGAIDYFNSQDKLMFSAAGTSLPLISELIGVIFPARYEPVVAVTGIENRESNGGAFVLGETSHGGEGMDFCVENTIASSEATSRMAGMAGLIWSANPDLTREEILEILISSSHFYQENGQKDPVFGWGTPDILEAVELALD